MGRTIQPRHDRDHRVENYRVKVQLMKEYFSIKDCPQMLMCACMSVHMYTHIHTDTFQSGSMDFVGICSRKPIHLKLNPAYQFL